MNTARKLRSRLPAVAAATLTALYFGINGSGQPAFAATFVSSDGTKTSANNGRTPPACHKRGAGHCAAVACGVNTHVNTDTALKASPNPATVGQTVTLTATVTASRKTTPAGKTTPVGTVQFKVAGTDIGPPVTLNSSGVATTTTTFAAAGTDRLSAVFTPANRTAFNPSTGTLHLTVLAAAAAAIPLATNVPASGAFTLTVDTTDTVTFAVSGSDATAATTPVTVSDTRNTFPGWSVSGQASDFTGNATAAGATISGNQLGWAPTSTGTLPQGVKLGRTVAPSAPGLGAAPAVLASAHAGSGSGTSTLGASLTLAIPASATPGQYAGSLTINAVTTLP